MIIDATDLIVGRLATVVAKKALLGEKIDIVNAEKAVLTGNKAKIITDLKARRDRGVPLQGPYYPRLADRMLRRAIRGMLPYKKEKGKKAFENIMCYLGVPESMKDGKMETIKEANVSKLPNIKYVSLGEISKTLGAKHG